MILDGKDFLGKVVKRGDWVVFEEKGYRNFTFGKVDDITDKTFSLVNLHPNINDCARNTRQLHTQVILVEEAVVPKKIKDLINDPNTFRVKINLY